MASHPSFMNEEKGQKVVPAIGRVFNAEIAPVTSFPTKMDGRRTAIENVKTSHLAEIKCPAIL